MRAESFYRLGAALGLTQKALDALLTGGEPPTVEEAGADGYVLVSISQADSVPGCEGIRTLVKTSTMTKWMKELDRLRNEERR